MSDSQTTEQKMADSPETPQPNNWFATCAGQANTLLVSLGDREVGPAGALARQSLHIWLQVNSERQLVTLSSVRGLRSGADPVSVQMPLMYEVQRPAKD